MCGIKLNISDKKFQLKQVNNNSLLFFFENENTFIKINYTSIYRRH